MWKSEKNGNLLLSSYENLNYLTSLNLFPHLCVRTRVCVCVCVCVCRGGRSGEWGNTKTYLLTMCYLRDIASEWHMTYAQYI